VERIDEHLETPDAVLVIIDAADGQVEGRTAVQKLAYFASVATGRDLGHHAHFFGPYSRPVEGALINEAFAGDLAETTNTFSSWSGPDIRQYTYRLTSQGGDAVAEIRDTSPHACRCIDDVVSKLKDLVPGLPQHPLSLAAKVDYILTRAGGAPTVSEIPALAKEYGWDVSEDDVKGAADILAGLGRVAAPRAETS
jgi:uncharacterized protein YwgA